MGMLIVILALVVGMWVYQELNEIYQRERQWRIEEELERQRFLKEREG